MSGDNLRECPFCGKEVKLDETVYYVNSHGEPGVWCWNCGAKGPNDVSYEYADKMWNMRRPEDALRARISDFEAERRWIPVGERLPERDGDYLVSNMPYGENVPIRKVEVQSFYKGAFRLKWCITHWMPIPPPPENL